MKKHLAVLAVLAFGCSDVTTEPVDVELAAVEAKGVYIVTLADGAPPGLAKKLAGSDLRHEFTAALSGFSARLSKGQAQGLARNPHVTGVHPNGLVHAMKPPEWGLDRIDQRTLPLDKSFTPSGSGSGATIYVIDTGVRISHNEFGGRASNGYTAYADFEDCYGHGTHVAAIAAGESYGVARGARVVNVRVLDCNGSGTFETVVAGVDWVTANAGPNAIANMSLGAYSGGDRGDPWTIMDEAVANSVASGITYAISAGNSNVSSCDITPARVPGALTVGAMDSDDVVPVWSATGDCTDLFAPGVDVRSAHIKSDNNAATFSGTSMAAPHVAGAAALKIGAANVHDAIVAASTPDQLSTLGRAIVHNRLLYVEPGDTPSCDKPNPKACK